MCSNPSNESSISDDIYIYIKIYKLFENGDELFSLGANF